MLHKALPLIVQELNSYLRRSLMLEEDIVILSELVNYQGIPLPETENRVVALVTAIEQEQSIQTNHSTNMARANPPLYLNLQLLFAAHFPGNYVEALQLTSLVLAYFHGKQVFTPQNTAGLPSTVGKITAEIANLDVPAQQRLWSALGAKMVPSVSIKLRMIVITRDQILQEVPEIRGTDTTTSHQ